VIAFNVAAQTLQNGRYNVEWVDCAPVEAAPNHGRDQTVIRPDLQSLSMTPSPRHSRDGAAAGPGATAETLSEALGAKIRLERRRAGITVRGLAERIGVSASLISQIERGRARPSVATLWSIATELGLPVGDLFDDTGAAAASEGGPGSVNPIQESEARKKITLAGGVRWERLTSRPDDEVDFIFAFYPVGAESCGTDSLSRHGGREFGYVISGTLGIQIGFEEYVVRADDSISFDSSMPHRLWAIGDEPVRAVWTVINRRGDPRSQSFD
jgi:transcriptional regulator with XRE-family HTH domain